MFSLIKNVIDNNYNALLHYPNVIGICASFKVIKNIVTSIPCLTVMVSHKYPKDYFSNDTLIPVHYKGAITDVIEDSNFEFNSFTFLMRPVVGGARITWYRVKDLFSDNEYTATVGCIVYGSNSDTGEKEPYLLTCSHIFWQYAEFLKNSHSELYQPSFNPLKEDRNLIGFLDKFIPIIKNKPDTSSLEYTLADAALIKLAPKIKSDPKIAVEPSIYSIGPITGVLDVETTSKIINRNIKAFGSTSGLMCGKIKAINAFVKYPQADKSVVVFKNKILTTKMSSRGDSGCVLLDTDNKILGVLASSSDSTSAWSPIVPILKYFDVSPFK